MNLYTIVDKIKEEWQHVKNENIQLYNIFIFYAMIEFNKTNINWLIIINLNHFEKYCKIRKNLKWHLTCFI